METSKVIKITYNSSGNEADLSWWRTEYDTSLAGDGVKLSYIDVNDTNYEAITKSVVISHDT